MWLLGQDTFQTTVSNVHFSSPVCKTWLITRSEICKESFFEKES